MKIGGMKTLFTGLLCGVFMISGFWIAAQAQAATTLTLAHVYPAKDVRGQTAAYWAKLVQTKTGGQVKVRVHPGGELIGGKELFGSTASGAVDSCLISSSYFTGEVPEIELFVLPLLPPSITQEDYWNTWRNNRSFWSTTIGKRGCQPLLAVPTGSFAVVVSRVPLRQVADFKGRKIRVAGGKVLPKSVELFGASPARVDAAEIYPALQHGAIDGCLTVEETYITESLHEVAPYLTKCRWYGSVNFILINPKSWAKLTPDQQKAVTSASEEAEAWGGKLTLEEGEIAAKKCRAKAKEYYVPSQEEQAKWFKMAEPLWKGWAAGIPDGQKLLGLLLK
jgi:TRAP-type C4-dicarboxylate transport system substrate-binding protein